MKVLGIVGGIGPDSTIDYYRSIVHQYRQAAADGPSPALVIRSVDVNVLVKLMSAARYPEVVTYLSAAIASLAAAGADFAIISANTPHIVFDELQALSPIPLLSIVEATCQAAKALHLHRLALIGTRFTMKGGFLSAGILAGRDRTDRARRPGTGLYPRDLPWRAVEGNLLAGNPAKGMPDRRAAGPRSPDSRCDSCRN